MTTPFSSVINRTRMDSVLATNTVIRNTYILLSLTLMFSALTAGLSMVTNAPPLGFITLLGYFGLFFLTHTLRNSPWGLVSIFALTGFMGYTLGPILNIYLRSFANGSELIMTALGGTGLIFLSLSAYALRTQEDFSYMTGFMAAASMVLLFGIIISLFFSTPILQLAIACGFMLFSSAMILFETSNIIHGGEKNYIMATISLYLSIYNLFLSLLQILGALNRRN